MAVTAQYAARGGAHVASSRVCGGLLALGAHQVEGVEVGVSLFRIRVMMHLAVGDLADEFLRCDHHCFFHARVGNVGDHLQREQCLLELNYMLLRILLEPFPRGFDHHLIDRQSCERLRVFNLLELDGAHLSY